MYDELIKRLRNCTAELNGEKTLWCQAADAIEDLAFVCNRYEKKLTELMGKAEFGKFSTDIAKGLFAVTIDNMAPSDFKDFCKANFDVTVGEADGD